MTRPCFYSPFLLFVASVTVVCCSALPARAAGVASDQRQVAIGYQRLEALALRIADAAEADDPQRAEQVREAIAKARGLGLGDRFERVVGLLERERFAAARGGQTELAEQLEELLRLVMADPGESRREEDRRRLEELRKALRAAIREQRGLRARTARGESAELAPRQNDLADRVERLIEVAPEEPRRGGPNTEADAGDSGEAGDGGEGSGSAGEAPPTLRERLQSAGESMRSAAQRLEDNAHGAQRDQREAQRELEAAQRETEERLRQLREDEQERRLATLAQRITQMLQEQEAVLAATEERVASVTASGRSTRADRVAAAKLAGREASIGEVAERALRLIRADGEALVFDEAMTAVLDDVRLAESRLREARLDGTTVAVERSIVEALRAMRESVDQAMDDLDAQRSAPGGGAAMSGVSPLVSRIAQLKMLRASQARVLAQTKVWHAAGQAGEAPAGEAAERLAELASRQRRLAEAADQLARGRR